MTLIGRQLDRLVRRVEEASGLDGAADKVAQPMRRLIPDGPIKDAASGTSAGHPLHPALVAVPMGAWLAATYLDFAPTSDRSGSLARRQVAQHFVAIGVVAAVPTAVAGASDWLDTAGAERRVGLVHAVANTAAVTGYLASWVLRRRGHHRAGVTVSAISGGVLGLAGWLGGHLVYATGVGVDTTAFQKFPTDWTDAGLAADDLPAGSAVAVEVGGVSVLVSRSGSMVHAIANRCTHRGAPLDEGLDQNSVADGCVTCPWHGSRFDLTDGAILRGPATRPQPSLQARVRGDRIEVRRPDEVRTLRLNPV